MNGGGYKITPGYRLSAETLNRLATPVPERLREDRMSITFECGHCRGDKFLIDTTTGNWYATCAYCRDEYELLPNGTAQLIRFGEPVDRGGVEP